MSATSDVPVFVLYGGRFEMVLRCVNALWEHKLGGCSYKSPNITIIDNTQRLAYERRYQKSNPLWSANLVSGDNAWRHLSPWHLGVLPQHRPFILMDEDIEIDPACPDNLVAMLAKVQELTAAPKVGLSIRTDDVPEVERYTFSLWHERDLNQRFTTGVIRHAEVDTHCAYYPAGTLANPGICGVRLAEPYTCRHLPWYNEELTDEEIAYYHFVGKGWADTHSASEVFACG